MLICINYHVFPPHPRYNFIIPQSFLLCLCLRFFRSNLIFLAFIWIWFNVIFISFIFISFLYFNFPPSYLNYIPYHCFTYFRLILSYIFLLMLIIFLFILSRFFHRILLSSSSLLFYSSTLFFPSPSFYSLSY